MSKLTVSPHRAGSYTIRLISKNDCAQYFTDCFSFGDPEVLRCTGSKWPVPFEEIDAYVSRIVDDGDRYDFLVLDQSGTILGESVLNEIDWQSRCANYRVCIFKSEHCGRGLGGLLLDHALEFGFRTLGLHRIELEVFSFNLRARRVYERAGFTAEGIRRDGILIDGQYYDTVLMSILESEYR